ncbi:MAG: helix-turn-helix domain-containing protein [Acidobacteriaceae bacterium]|nr:helix-turn-helix domain-containing protein [Acidobacteriaceae bacterium]
MLTDREVAARLGVKVDTVRKWRLRGLGPLAIRVGGAVRYRLSDLEFWISSQPTLGCRAEGN